MNVTAHEKTGKRTNNIKIVNDKGRLSAEEIERLVKEAEEMKIADERAKDKAEARNELEQMGSVIKSVLYEEKYQGKISTKDRKNLE